MEKCLRLFFSNRDLIAHCLVPYLSIFDCISLLSTASFIWNAYKRAFSLTSFDSATKHAFDWRLTQSLAQFFGNANAAIFMEHLQCGNLALTGGFLLAVLNGENVQICKDVDFVMILNRSSDKIMESNFNTLQHSFDNKIVHTTNRPGTDYGKCFSVDSYTFEAFAKRRFQLISIIKKSHGRALQEYCADFDLKFCSNYYVQNKLVIMYGEHARQKTCNLCLFKFFGTWRERMPPQVLVSRLFPKYWKRICKYRRRGYIITLADQHINPTLKNADVWNIFWADKI